MKRLKLLLSSMMTDTKTYKEMYEGRITFIDPSYGGAGIEDEVPIYYRGDVGFEITHTNKLAQDKPTVLIMIPYDEILNETGENCYLKRLRYYLNNMPNDTKTYKEMYEGERLLIYSAANGYPTEPPPDREYVPVYWHDDCSFELTETNRLSKDKPTVTWRIPTERLRIETYTKAAADFCLREFGRYIDELNSELYNRFRPDNENGKYYIYKPGGEVLTRNTSYFAVCDQRDYEYGSGTAVYLLPPDKMPKPKTCLCIRMQVQLPYRKIKKAIQMLCRDLPGAVDKFISEFDVARFSAAMELAEKQAAIREYLKSSDYCAFIANGSVLPRSKGTDRPLEGAVPFVSTIEDEIEICSVRGMGIRKGVTVVTGGGYSGKSTLLDAISAGIYDHAPGDGRELCITDDTAVGISAEDGRSVSHVNISPFIKWLPGGDTRDFSTEHASGSTSQAANIAEAVEGGAKLLLIDEDRSATNFMIRDNVMKKLIEKEPITPFTDRVRELYNALGVSTVLVIGGSGEYLSVADRVYMMEDYLIRDLTEKAKSLCQTPFAPPDKADWEQKRQLYSDGFTSYPEGCGTERLEVSDMGFIIIGDETIDVRGLHNIVSKRQLDALGYMLRMLEITNADKKIDIAKKIEELYQKIENEGLDSVFSSFFTTTERFLDLPRKQELYAVINRMRRIRTVNIRLF